MELNSLRKNKFCIAMQDVQVICISFSFLLLAKSKHRVENETNIPKPTPALNAGYLISFKYSGLVGP